MRMHLTKEDELIQNMVLDAFHHCWVNRRSIKRSVHIRWIQLRVWKVFDELLTYKQVRDALFRLRHYWNIQHVGCGFYWLVIT